MASIASKNLYDLLGNDPELDPDREPEPPVQVVEKPIPRTGKRSTGGDRPRDGPRGAPRGGGTDVTGHDQSFRDRGPSYENRSHPPDGVGRHPDRLRGSERYSGRGRGGRSSRGRSRGAVLGDRHPNRTGIAEHEKQAGHGWGENTGEAEFADEKAGEAMAKEEEKEGWGTSAEPPVNDEGAPDAAEGVEAPGDAEASAEPEAPKQLTLDAYLAEQASKKMNLASNLEPRKPNEGSTKKFKEGKAFKRSEEEETFFAGAGPKAKRERQQKEKQKVDLEGQFYAPPEVDGGRGGRGRGRGRGGPGYTPRGRGDSRGRGRGDRGEYRGGRGRGPTSPNVDDQTAFPSLGA